MPHSWSVSWGHKEAGSQRVSHPPTPFFPYSGPLMTYHSSFIQNYVLQSSINVPDRGSHHSTRTSQQQLKIGSPAAPLRLATPPLKRYGVDLSTIVFVRCWSSLILPDHAPLSRPLFARVFVLREGKVNIQKSLWFAFPVMIQVDTTALLWNSLPSFILSSSSLASFLHSRQILTLSLILFSFGLHEFFSLWISRSIFALDFTLWRLIVRFWQKLSIEKELSDAKGLNYLAIIVRSKIIHVLPHLRHNHVWFNNPL